MNNNLLVVGGTGFIGSSITEEALKQGYNVTVVSKGHVPSEKQTKRVTYISVDIANKIDLLIELDKNNFNYVVNLAGYVDHSDYFDGGEEVVNVHLDGTLNLISCINKKHLIKYVQIGSSDEYGDNASPQNEAQRESPISPYSFAKTAATHFLQMLYRTEGLPVVVIRPFLVYGPGQNNSRFIPQVIKGCISNKEFPVSKGEQLRDFCYITDFVDAVFLILKNEKTNGNVINIASGNPVMIKDVINKIVLHVGSGIPKFDEIKYRKNENMKLYADITKASVILGWQPKVNLDSGLKKTINWINNFE
jgi:nucleoside-diphosphate-sugar epimerase